MAARSKLAKKSAPDGIIGKLVMIPRMPSDSFVLEGTDYIRGTIPPIPESLYAMYVFAAYCPRSHSFIVAGGKKATTGICSNLVSKLECDTVTWKDCPSMKYARMAATATCLEDGITLLVCGGKMNESDDGITATCELYNTVTDTWSSARGMKHKRHWHATVLYEGRVVVLGGSSQNLSLPHVIWATCEQYDAVTDQWTPFPSLSEPRYLHCAETINNKIYIVGGNCQAHVDLSDVDVFDGGAWLTITQTPGLTWYGYSVNFKGKLMVFSKQNAKALLYDPVVDTWSQFQPDFPEIPSGIVALLD